MKITRVLLLLGILGIVALCGDSKGALLEKPPVQGTPSPLPSPLPSSSPSPHPVPASSLPPVSPLSELPFGVNPSAEFVKKNVEFWTRIYGEYDSFQGVIHDAKYIDHVYEVIDLHNVGPKPSHIVRNQVRKWRDVLLRVHKKQAHPEEMNAEERRVFELFRDVSEPAKFLNATHRKRVRFQLGQKDRFREGYIQSGRYLPWMEQIFRREGLPVELTRLPFVESSFNLHARSKVGASGIWQFMRSTGRLFLRINAALDERNDPIRATEAAAKLLKLNYESLKNWPLAVTAYNHGRQGMMRAVQVTGFEDLDRLMGSYHSRSFGFASSNFFSELMAAIEVEKNADRYFGKLNRAPKAEFVELKLLRAFNIKNLAQHLEVNLDLIRELNPAVKDEVYTGRIFLPEGYLLRLPLPLGMKPEVAMKAYLDRYDSMMAKGIKP